MNFQEAVNYATVELKHCSDTPKLDAQLLVCHTCETDHTLLIAHPEKKLSGKKLELFKSFLARRSQGEPMAYITGKKEFWSLDFIVNKNVLIPRPETELLVEITLDVISNIQSPRILDLGTGSGAIAISIAKERSDCVVKATDISETALETAKLNAVKHDVEITFIHSNWFESLSDEKFDVIVCNPPYVAKDDKNLNEFVTKFEPDNSVISNNSGLFDIELIINQTEHYLNNSGCTLIEHGFEQSLKVQQIFRENRFKNVQTYKDFSGHNRVTSGCR